MAVARRRQHALPFPAAEGGSNELSGYCRGAVLKLRLYNFLTFDDVVIEPKPQLNVIVGPNGTGKSSIVCALCLGLAGSTGLLGRAKDVKDFVKHGCMMGFVEITLYDDRASKNPVMRRTMSSENNSSKWTINRLTVAEKEVKKLVESLGIQLDNKCMFLPQDKVVEFARMNKQELLLETEKAAGPKELHKNHEELKDLQVKQALSSHDVKSKKRELEDMERKNRLLERDVAKYQDRQKILTDIKSLTFKKRWVLYQEAREAYDKKKVEKKQAHNKFKRATEEYQPIKDRLNMEEEEVEKCKREAQKCSKEMHSCFNKIREVKGRLLEVGDMLDQPKAELEMAKERERKRRAKIETLRKEIKGFKAALADIESAESVTGKVQQLNESIKSIQEEISRLSDHQGDIKTAREEQLETVRRSEEELRRIDNVRTQRLQKMEQRREFATVEVMSWLQNNQKLFKHLIFEPICMSLNIRNPHYGKQAEAFFGGRDFYSFVAQCEEDRELFLREVRDKLKKKVNIVRAPSHALKDYQPQISFETLRQFGFVEMLVNIVEAPEPVLCYFCQFHRLHEVPIAGNLGPEDIQRITSSLKKLQSFFTSNMRYSVKRSKYREITSTRSNELFQPFFLVASVDANKKKDLQKAIRDANLALQQSDEQYRQLDSEDQRYRREDAKLRDEKKQLRVIMDNRRSTVSNIKSREKRLEQEQNKTKEFDIKSEKEKCVQAVAELHRRRVDLLGVVKGHVEACIFRTDRVVCTNLAVSTAESRSNYLKSRFCQAKSVLSEAKHKMELVMESESLSKRLASDLLSRARQETGVHKPEDNPELMRSFQLFPDQLDKIEEQLHDLNAQAEISAGTDAQVFEEFQMRKEGIEALKKEISSMENHLDNADSRIKELKERWMGPLKELIQKVDTRFSSYFSSHMQIKCAGQVILEPGPRESSDFDKYGVQIKVKFRDQEELQELNAQRQSGGERSVSTMLYLMALQGNTSCPFRVVDEINQGMDPVNERHVFNLIVKSASEGSQYFLLTPKILQNLEYSKAVTVHIVNNGQEIMNCDRWSLSKFLN